MLKKSILLAGLSILAGSTFAASTVQDNTNFLNQQLHAMVNDTGVTPLQNWFKHIQVSALMNLDFFAQSNYRYLQSHQQFVDGLFKEGSQSAFNVATLAMNVDANINTWVRAHTSLFYATKAQPAGISGEAATGGDNVIPTRYYPSSAPGTNFNDNIDLDEAYVDVGDFDKAPIDVRIGKQYFGYGEYDRYAMMPTLTQQLSELRDTGVELNYIGHEGLYGDVFAFRGLRTGKARAGNLVEDDSHMIRNFGVTAGFSHAINKLRINANAGYLYNIADIGTFNAQFNDEGEPRSGGWNANASVVMGSAKLGVQYAAVISPIVQFGWDNSFNTVTPKNAKPSAGNVYLDYGFKTAGYDSKLNLSYQWSDEANTYDYRSYKNPPSVDRAEPLFVLPESRIAGEYDINILKNTMLGFEVNYDSAYSKDHNGSGDSSLTGIARLSVLL